MIRKSAWENYDAASLEKLETFSKEYRAFIDAGKTERECVALAVEAAKAAGCIDLEEAAREGRKLVPGDRVYRSWMNKSVVLFVVGEKSLDEGMQILGAHIDSPRIDIKQNPLYEDEGLAYLDTHYYGGIKKYQWVAIPLAMHGVIVRIDGSVLTVSIGENEDDPVFCISALLPHLAQDQMKKTGSEIIGGEELNLIIGGRPLPDEEKDPVKAAILKLLKDRYDVEEDDFISAELEIVPAGKSRDMGLDGSMILGYGHDDRVCAYPSMRALLDYQGVPQRTLCCVMTDKEEIGSVGATGMRSRWFEDAMAEVLELAGESGSLPLRRCLERSCVLSNDVSVGYDPAFPSVYDPKNAAYLGHGVSFIKFTGARGKSGSNDANAEYVAALRRVMDEAGVHWQTSELGKVDAGGGGTIAYMLANYGMSVIDCGIPVLSMHAPWEVTSKADVFDAYRAYKAFLNQK